MGSEAIRGFATVCCLGEFRAVTAELLDALLESRLYDRMESLEIAVLGAPGDQEAVRELVRPFEKIRVVYSSPHVDEFEFPALGLLEDACRSWSGSVFYLHTKGVSRPPLDQHVRYWRALMLDEVVRNHEACTGLLVDHDTVGTNWRWNHYSGNFWWARSDHIRRLPAIRTLRLRPRRICDDPIWNLRLQCEFWVGMAVGRFANLGVHGLDLYATYRWSMDAATVVNDLLAALGGEHRAEIRTGNAPTDDSSPDVVLVDGWHDEEDCWKDISAALSWVRDGGAVVVHDTNPPTAWHQRDGADYVAGSEWNGTAWRAVHRFRRENPETWVHTVDTDWGCTVIIPGLSSPAPRPELPADPSWEWFERHRDDALGLVRPSRFRRQLHAIPYVTGRRPLTTRTEVLNCLASWWGLERYLEIGVAAAENLDAVIAPVRHGVDPLGSSTFAMTSDAFFASGRGCRHYDLVFIDGLHEEDQVLRDVEHALDRLADGGVIVLHDANPPTEWHQRPLADYQPGEDWNGSVWKAVVRLRAQHPELSVVTLDVDWAAPWSGVRRRRRGGPSPTSRTSSLGSTSPHAGRSSSTSRQPRWSEVDPA